MADYLYVVQMDIPADKEADFNRIYDLLTGRAGESDAGMDS